MGLRGEAAIVGYVELPPERMNKALPRPFTLEQWAELRPRRSPLPGFRENWSTEL